VFAERADAGRKLARHLAAYSRNDPLILALPRGGVPVAAQVAEWLNADLDVLVVRKLGVPGNPEFAMGAVGEDGVRIIDGPLVRQLHVTDEQIDQIAADESREVLRRVQRYRGGGDRLVVSRRNVIVVDDGVATGSTAAAAVAVVRRLGAAHVTVAVPVGSVQAVDWLRTLADDVVCVEVPNPFFAVSQHFDVFPQISDEEVIRLLHAHPRRDEPLAATGDRLNEEILIETGDLRLDGHVCIPSGAQGIVLFAHGSGSSRLSPRNVSVAKVLNSAGLGTLLFDLLTSHEADVRNNVFDIELLADRLGLVTDWLLDQPYGSDRKLGYFGASTGAAAALVANAKKPDAISAIVSRGGRPDLAGGWLGQVTAPTLLIVGGQDFDVIELNREAQRRLQPPNLLEIVKGATHLFEEPGALCQVSRLAQSWFLQYLR
jgi:putative phosphoribosyl transferase